MTSDVNKTTLQEECHGINNVCLQQQQILDLMVKEISIQL